MGPHVRQRFSVPGAFESWAGVVPSRSFVRSWDCQAFDADNGHRCHAGSSCRIVAFLQQSACSRGSHAIGTTSSKNAILCSTLPPIEMLRVAAKEELISPRRRGFFVVVECGILTSIPRVKRCVLFLGLLCATTICDRYKLRWSKGRICCLRKKDNQ